MPAPFTEETRMVKGIAHVCYTASDLEKSIAFYRDKLGMTEAFPFLKPDGRKFGVYLHAGGRGFIEIFEGKPAEKVEGQSYRHLCIEVEDIEATVKALRAKGVEVTDVKLGGDGTWQAWLADPDGNRIELHDYTPESKQGPWLK
jgi:catechol 2,3-dioxygenase-like lactoylglutathione lyase family enzyme